MPLQIPNLDDRQFSDLVSELESRIPRYLPEWTNRNLSDPGVALIELFSWLGEILIYRMNQVPNKNYIAFLKLIGVKQLAAVPATADLTFVLSNPAAGPVVIPQGTQVAASAPPPPPSVNAPPSLPATPAPPTIFETNEPMIALGNALKHIQVFDGVSFAEYTQQNNIAGDFFPAFGVKAKSGSYLLLGFDANMPFPAVELNLTFVLWRDPNLIQPFSSQTSKDPSLPQAVLAWEYWNGFSWKKLTVLKDDTNSLLLSGHFYFLGPKDISAGTVGTVTEPVNWLRARLVSSQYEVIPQISAVLTNTVRATAVTTVRDEVVGSSNGQANQTFTVANVPIYASDPIADDALLQFDASNPKNPTDEQQQQIDATIQQMELVKGFLLEVDEGLGSEPWLEVSDFLAATPDDPVYTVDRTSGLITFGGRIPLAGTNNIVVRYYRYGGGATSNLPAGAITDLQTPVAGVDSVNNFSPSTGGDDEEALADTEARAPVELKARDRAVTREDFEFLAMKAPGTRIRRAHALPLYHPEFPTVQVPGVVTVIVVPDTEAPKPIPSDSTLASVAAYLDQRRLLTTELFIAPPLYVQIRVNAIVEARLGTDPAQLQQGIVAALNAYLNPLTGGDSGQGWPMGGSVVYSSVYRVVLLVQGVQSIDLLQLFSDGNLQPAFQNVAIPSDRLVYSDGHDVQVIFPAG
jgi:predicted phage baseplate assembly protein